MEQITLDDLKKHLEKSGPRAFARFMPEPMKTWVMDQTTHLPDTCDLPERVWNILNPGRAYQCEYGGVPKFRSLTYGYRKFCGPKSSCQCASVNQSQKMSEHHSKKSDEERKQFSEKVSKGWTDETKIRANQTRVHTLQNTHGVINVSQIPDVREKVRETMASKYGGEFLASEEARQRIAETNVKKYGYSVPVKNPKVREKLRASVKRAFLDKSIERRKRLTCFQKYGVENPSQCPEIYEKIRKTFEEKYGGHPLKTDGPKRKLMAAKVGEEAARLLYDREWMESRRDLPIPEIAELLGVSYGTVLKYQRLHEIYVPYRSNGELEIGSFVESLGFWVERGNRKILAGSEIDIFIPEIGLALEYDGLFWHSEIGGGRGRDYHINKKEKCQSAGLRLINVLEDEWLDKRQAVMNRITHVLGKNDRGPGARKLEIAQIPWSTASDFLHLHHLQGSGAATSVNYGAFHDGRLVSVMTFSKGGRLSLGSKRRKTPELVRFCTNGKHYPGVASRIFRRYVEDHRPEEVISYADRRWSDGGLYRALGFSLEGASGPNYWYTNDYRTRHHRFKFRKDVLVREYGADPKLTEWEIMQSLGYDRVWDCGSLKFRWTP